jgi:hypothetical protein
MDRRASSCRARGDRHRLALLAHGSQSPDCNPDAGRVIAGDPGGPGGRAQAWPPLAGASQSSPAGRAGRRADHAGPRASARRSRSCSARQPLRRDRGSSGWSSRARGCVTHQPPALHLETSSHGPPITLIPTLHSREGHRPSGQEYHGAIESGPSPVDMAWPLLCSSTGARIGGFLAGPYECQRIRRHGRPGVPGFVIPTGHVRPGPAGEGQGVLQEPCPGSAMHGLMP